MTADRNVYRYASKQNVWEAKELTLQVTTFYDISLRIRLDVEVVYGHFARPP